LPNHIMIMIEAQGDDHDEDITVRWDPGIVFVKWRPSQCCWRWALSFIW
jgi:hypothetical protein